MRVIPFCKQYSEKIIIFIFLVVLYERLNMKYLDLYWTESTLKFQTFF